MRLKELTLAQSALAPGRLLREKNLIVGASRPEQLEDTVKAADLVLGHETLQLIDDALGDVVERDPAKVESFPQRV